MFSSSSALSPVTTTIGETPARFKVMIMRRIAVLSPTGSKGLKTEFLLLCPAATITAPVRSSFSSFLTPCFPFPFLMSVLQFSPLKAGSTDVSARRYSGTTPAASWVWMVFSFFHHKPLLRVIYHSNGISEILGSTTGIRFSSPASFFGLCLLLLPKAQNHGHGYRWQLYHLQPNGQ